MASALEELADAASVSGGCNDEFGDGDSQEVNQTEVDEVLEVKARRKKRSTLQVLGGDIVELEADLTEVEEVL